jgi:hypothetical protein
VVEGVVVAALTSTVSFVLPMLVACVVRGGGGGRGGGRQGPCEDSGGRDGKRGRAEVWMRGICITSPVVGGQFMLSAVRCFSVSCVTPDPPTPTHTHLHRPLPPPPPPCLGLPAGHGGGVPAPRQLPQRQLCGVQLRHLLRVQRPGHPLLQHTGGCGPEGGRRGQGVVRSVWRIGSR